MKGQQQKRLQLEGGLDSGPLFAPGCKLKPGAGLLRARKYRAKLRRATPPWADKAKIRAVYKEAKMLTKATGLLHSVDHKIPLKGELVCGLHVEYNLEVVLHKDNMRKGNFFGAEQCELW